MRQDRSERGFTLLEIMIVVVIIAVLAAVVVPTWMKETRKGKYDPEVRAMFTEISGKEEAYRADTGAGMYRNSLLGGGPCPSTPNSSGINFTTTCVAAGAGSADWQALRVDPTDANIRCTYEIHDGCAGVAGTNCPTGALATTAADSTAVGAPTLPFGTAAPATLVGPWYYIVATCDMDGQGGTYSKFLTSSWDTSIQKQNYGQ